MEAGPTKPRAAWDIRFAIAVASSVFSVALIVLGLGAGTKSPKKEPSAGASGTAQAPPKKLIRPWNVALGNVVVVPQELGFQITSAKNNAVEQNKLISKIESQLQSLREIYRMESDKNATLMGGMTLQLDINPSGEISHVKEIASRITDTEFKKAVIAEVSRWSFEKVVTTSVTVNCPLLFVREGMDITTVVQWEKSLGQFSDKSALAMNAVQPARQSKAESKSMASVSKVSSSPNAAAKPGSFIYIKYATALRKEPNFSSMSLAKFSVGTKVIPLASRGQWLEVRTEDNAQSGFIRKEFVSTLDLAQKQMMRD